MWTPKHLLEPVQSMQVDIDRSFLAAKALLRQMISGAEVHHVGSTALSPTLCRGTIDIEVLVDTPDLASASEAVAKIEELKALPRPVQVSVGDRHKESQKLRVRHQLSHAPILLGEYLALQKQFIHRVGRPYPEAKAEFFARLAQEEAPDFDQSQIAPYRLELATERLRLVSALACDGAAFAEYQYRNRERLAIYSSSRGDDVFGAELWQERFGSEPIRRWQKQAMNLLCLRREDSKLLGVVNFSGFVWGPFKTCNLGYNVDSEHEGQGYMSEAVKAAMDYVFKRWGLRRLTAAYHPDNVRSGKLLERLGFEIEGRAKQFIELGEARHDSILAALVR